MADLLMGDVPESAVAAFDPPAGRLGLPASE